MAVSFENCLVVGISSRALFDLTKENEIFEKEGLDAYSTYQIEQRGSVLQYLRRFSGVQCRLVQNHTRNHELDGSLPPQQQNLAKDFGTLRAVTAAQSQQLTAAVV